jgi:hypothetical protein
MPRTVRSPRREARQQGRGATTLGDGDVDFVVVGFGLGALGVLLGVVMLGWLAPRAQRAATRVSSPDDVARCQAIAAEHRGTGQALLYSGGAMLLVTVAALGGSLDDRTGALLVTTTATVAAVGILFAGYLQRLRNPVPPRPRTRSAPAASASMAMIPPPVDTPSLLVDAPPWVQDAVPAESNSEGPPSEDFPPGDSEGEATIVKEQAPSLPVAGGEDSSGTTKIDPLGDSSVAMETIDSGIWQPADLAAGHTSAGTDLVESEDARNAGDVVSTTRSIGSSPSRTDEEGPPPGHLS